MSEQNSLSLFREQFLPFGKPSFDMEEIEALARVMGSGWIGMGQETIAFEKELAAFVKAPRVVTLDTCTSALFLSLLVSGVGEGDEVIVPSLTWCSTANAALYLKATPVFADIDPKHFCLTSQSILEKITPKTKAVIVVHYGGYAQDVEKLRSTLPPHIALIEDAAHALGSQYPNGKPVGSTGNLTCYSFYANKNLSTGEGGAIATFDETVADRLESLRLHALSAHAWMRFTDPKKLIEKKGLDTLGYKMNYTDLQACIGRVQLKKQREFADLRLCIAEYYMQALEAEFPGEFQCQQNVLLPKHARHLFVLLVPKEFTAKRNDFVMTLRERHIGASIHYSPLHQMPLYESTERLSVTEDVCNRCITLPISASMSMTDAESVIHTFIALYKETA